MPPTRRTSAGRRAVVPLLAGTVFIALLALALWGVAAWVSRNAGEGSRLDVNLGDDYFDAGPAARRAEEIAERGPTLYPGLLGPDEGYIFVNHLGDDPGRGWRAFAATPEGSPVACSVEWQPDRTAFVDPCTGDAYPPDGSGLTQYPIYVTPERTVLVDLTPEGAPGRGPSTVPPTTG